MDAEQATAAHPDDPDCVFEKLMLETVEGKFEKFKEQWRQFLTSSVSPQDETTASYLRIFQAVLIIEPENGVPAAATGGARYASQRWRHGRYGPVPDRVVRVGG